MVGFKMVGARGVNLAFVEFRKAGQDRYRSITVCVQSVGMTTAAFQSLGISDDTKEMLNRLVIGVATISADNFRKRESRLSSPADLQGSRFCSSFRISAIWIWVLVLDCYVSAVVFVLQCFSSNVLLSWFQCYISAVLLVLVLQQ